MAYRSKFEARIAGELDFQKVDYEYETIEISYVCTYKPDFILPNGILIEAKGYLRPENRPMMIKVKKQNPELDIRFVFQSPHSKINGAKNLTFAKWADKNGFKWAHGSIPRSWLEE